MKELKLPDEVKYILNKLNSNGYEAFVVGGCVRDSLLGSKPKDWDITTNALPLETKALFKKTIDTGLKHGTVTVVMNNENFEITTYRIDGEYTDNRRPDKVEFTSSIKEDLGRRDFTVNALAYHPTEGLIDFWGGKEDLEGKIIRAVRNPDERFKEDALRMLRAIRFCAQLNFHIEPCTFKAIINNCKLIKNISLERIRDEITKTLISPNPSKLMLLNDSKLIGIILPEFYNCIGVEQNNPYHVFNVAEHIISSVKHIESDKILRWTMLLHDIGKPESKTTDSAGVDHFYGHPKISVELSSEILKRLKFDNKSIDTILTLIEYHDILLVPNNKSVKKALNKMSDEVFLMLLKVKEADAKAQNKVFLEERLNIIEKIRETFFIIHQTHQCARLKDLAINGNDIINLGIKQGKAVGLILNNLLERVIENPDINTTKALTEIVKSEFLD
ncbi:MAG: HD domain-containing protein [Bacillota bacterium]|nr:HD domain-containing protein [Bacillota bacterium]